jgi:chemotaxis protein histidine kinase CheA
MDELLSEFLIETQGRLAALDTDLTAFPQSPGKVDTQTHILELMHTIKGASVLLGLPRLQAIAQASERVLTPARGKPASIAPEIATLIVDAIGVIRRIQRGIATSGHEPPGDDSELLRDLAAAAAGRPLKRAVPPPVAPSTSSPQTQAAPSEPPTQPVAPRDEERRALAPLQSGVPVPKERIEHLTSLVGDLVLTRNSLNHLLQNRDDPELEEPLQRLSHITSDLGAGLMTTRKLALGEATAESRAPFDIMSAITVESGGLRYAIPQRSVLELVRLVPGARRIASDEVRELRLRERRYPWVRLTSLLKRAQPTKRSDAREIIVMIETGGTPFGVAVDRVYDVEEIVVRPLPPVLNGIPAFAGSAVLSDGAIGMVLDPKWMAAEIAHDRERTLVDGRGAPRLAPRG